jgi:thioredoxin reductase
MTYDVIVIGGGPAGLSGAVALGRALRSVLVIDSGAPRNAPAEGIHNFLTRDGMTPAEFRAAGRAEVERYGGRIVDAEVAAVLKPEPGPADGVANPSPSAAAFVVTLSDGSVHEARRLLVTTGLVDELPDIPGLAERWGTTLLHCPYCHGYEVRGKAIGVLGDAGSPMLAEKVRLWRQWSADVLPLALEEIDRVVDGGVWRTDGTFVARDYLVASPRFVARAGFLDGLGLTTVEHPMGIGTYVPAADPTGRTDVPGVWVAGNVTDLMAQVITAAGAGLMAGAAINLDLLPPAPGTH